MNSPDRLHNESGLGEQLALLPELEIVPVAPRPGTLANALLRMLARGDRLTHPEFEDRTGSWRLAAFAFELAALGWPVGVTRIPAPTPERPDRTIGRYWLPEKARRQVAEARLVPADALEGGA
jgi:hypothetical protein